MSRNLATVTSIHPYTDAASLGTSLATIVSAPATGKVRKIESIIVSNVDGTNDADVNVTLNLDGGDYYIAKTVTVPADSTLVVLSSDNPLYLRASYDTIRASASATSDLQILVSYQEITTSA